MDDPRTSDQDRGGYAPPEVEDLPATDGPAVTSADGSVGDAGPGPEWRPAAPNEPPNNAL